MNRIEEYSFPEELKNMKPEDIDGLCDELRDFMISSVSETGGHLASNLGIVELTVALHRIFDPFKDRIIWDVGHQSYVHKILTGRADGFKSLRKFKGLSGFPKQAESDADVFDTGHASDSISLAAGLAAARDIRGEDYQVVAVIGDGSLTGGMSFEGLNNIGGLKSKAIIILNDNGMSISKSTGGLSRHLGKLRLSSSYEHAKTRVHSALDKVPVLGKGIAAGIAGVKNSVKYVLVHGEGAMFEALGMTYIGPIDGHNEALLEETLQAAKEADGPVIVHVVTKKGKGYGPAEKNPGIFHGIGAFNKESGIPKASGESYSLCAGRKLTDMGLADSRVCCIYAAMADGTGMEVFTETFPERTFDVGISEEHAAAFAAGLAKAGMRPYVAIYSTFLQRAYDQILEDVCLQKMPVTFLVDRAGCVGADGETHHGMFDISYFSSMPGMTVMAPKDFKELEQMMEASHTMDGPCAIRYPRGGEKKLPDEFMDEPVAPGRAQVLVTGSDVEIWAAGNMTAQAVEIFKMLDEMGIKTGIINARYLKPLDREALLASADRTGMIVTMEDHTIIGGFGSLVKSELPEKKVLSFGWPSKFIEHGSVNELQEMYGLDTKSITERILQELERK